MILNILEKAKEESYQMTIFDLLAASIFDDKFLSWFYTPENPKKMVKSVWAKNENWNSKSFWYNLNLQEPSVNIVRVMKLGKP